MMTDKAKESVRRKVETVRQKLDTLSRIRVQGMEENEADAIRAALKTDFMRVNDHLSYLVATPAEKMKRKKVSFSFDGDNEVEEG